MSSQRKDIWGVLQIQCAKMGKEFLKTSSLKEIADLENKWLDPRRGVIARLMNKPILVKARPSAQKVFVQYLGHQDRNASKYSKIWLDD